MKELVIALAGQPNVGKTALINALSGAHLRVGNFSGVTIEKAEARLEYQGIPIRIIDLPGTYSINDYTPEEKVTKEFLEKESYDLILNVADSTNLERNLSLTTQILGINKKVVLALNMADEAKEEGIKIDTEQLKQILGIEVAMVSASTKEGIDELLSLCVEVAERPYSASKRIYAPYIEEQILVIDRLLEERQYNGINELKNQPEFINYSFRDIAIGLLKQNDSIYAFLSAKPCWEELSGVVKECTQVLFKSTPYKSLHDIFSADVYSFAKGAATEVVSETQTNKEAKTLTQRIDSILLNKYLGIPIFLVLMFIVFEITFVVGGWGQDYLAELVDYLAGVVSDVFSPYPALASLLGDGIVQGVGAVLSFVPLIMILYLGITLLETTGYMARVSFLLDGLFHKFGLHGKSFIPLVTGFGCSVPAYMATRILQNKNERLITLFIIGFMSCSARLPVYTLFIGAFFAPKYAGLILFIIYIAGPIVALLMAKLLKLTVFSGKNEPFVMEMPKYRLPTVRVVWFSIWMKTKMYIKKAGTFILVGSVLIWVASQYPKSVALEDTLNTNLAAIEANVSLSKDEKEERATKLENQYDKDQLHESYMGKLGDFMQPMFAPMGYDWRMSVSLLTGLAAKEVVVSTLSVLYALGEADESDPGLVAKLRANVSFPTAVSFIVFIMFYIPCFAAIMVFAKEADGAKNTISLFVFTTVVAYIMAFIAYHIAALC